MTIRRAALALLFAAAALAGCGKQGDLERPHPTFGQPPAPAAQASARDEAARRAFSDASVKANPRAPESIDELRNLTGSKHKAVQSEDATNPSAPHPPGSPLEPDAAAPPAPQ